MNQGIVKTLQELAEDEGTLHALSVAERWRDALEEIAEAANKEELTALTVVFKAVREVLGVLLYDAHVAICPDCQVMTKCREGLALEKLATRG